MYVCICKSLICSMSSLSLLIANEVSKLIIQKCWVVAFHHRMSSQYGFLKHYSRSIGFKNFFLFQKTTKSYSELESSSTTLAYVVHTGMCMYVHTFVCSPIHVLEKSAYVLHTYIQMSIRMYRLPLFCSSVCHCRILEYNKIQISIRTKIRCFDEDPSYTQLYMYICSYVCMNKV